MLLWLAGLFPVEVCAQGCGQEPAWDIVPKVLPVPCFGYWAVPLLSSMGDVV